jgi:uncharacterized protein (DUF2384 family)
MGIKINLLRQMSYIRMTNDGMAKKVKSKRYSPTAKAPKVPKVQEPAVEYKTVKKIPLVAEFSYKKFEKIAAMAPFTQKEWSNILHLSERTLQRYAKDNSSFEGIYTDRILHIEELIKQGIKTFVTGDAFYRWLKREKPVLGKILNFESLYSMQGIQSIIDELERIQWGVYI